MECRDSDGKRHNTGNHSARDKDCRTPNDTTVMRGPLASPSTMIKRYMVYGHIVVQGKVKTWKYMCKRLYTGKVHKGDTHDIEGGCRKIINRLYGRCWNSRMSYYRRSYRIHRQTHGVHQRSPKNVNHATYNRART